LRVIRHIRDAFADSRVARRPVLSFEFFPTKTADGERSLLETTIPALCELHPDFCSVTYGAGGGTRDKTFSIVDRIQREHGLTTMAHLTCVGVTRDETRVVLEDAWARGIRNLLALRGDPPDPSTGFVKPVGGFEYSYELVRFIRDVGDFSIGVAGFPEGHIACRDGKHEDWKRLKHKIDQGADFVITQLFFRNSDYFECCDFLAALGVTTPVVPGILPILSARQVKRFTALCGAAMPTELLARLDDCADDDDAMKLGIEYATSQCEELLRGGAPGLHFYTLNRSTSATEVLRNLGLARRPVLPGVAG
jgi:methylenetetrahydrofolate reductase (NADPH)